VLLSSPRWSLETNPSVGQSAALLRAPERSHLALWPSMFNLAELWSGGFLLVQSPWPSEPTVSADELQAPTVCFSYISQPTAPISSPCNLTWSQPPTRKRSFNLAPATRRCPDSRSFVALFDTQEALSIYANLGRSAQEAGRGYYLHRRGKGDLGDAQASLIFCDKPT